MHKPCAFNAAQAMGLIGQTVMVEQVWEQDPEPIWHCFHIVGVVLPIEGLVEEGYFLVLNALQGARYPHEVFWSSIRTLRILRRRKLPGSNPPPPVLGGLIRSAITGAAAFLRQPLHHEGRRSPDLAAGSGVYDRGDGDALCASGA